MQFLNNNTTETLGRIMQNSTNELRESGKIDADVVIGFDCMICGFLSWGHNTVKNFPRFQPSAIGNWKEGLNYKTSDFNVSLSEHPLRFNNLHFWLGAVDNTWHRPMQIYVRSEASLH